MDSSGTEVVDDADAHVFVCVDDSETRTALRDWLDGRYTVVEGSAPDLADADADLSVFDRASLADAPQHVERARRCASPAHLPVLLVPTYGDGRDQTTTLSSADATIQPLIDDVIGWPIQPGELVRRVRSLLRIRRLSVQFADQRRAYRDVLDLFETGVCLLADGDVEHCNDAACSLLDIHDPDAAVGQSFLDLVAAGDRPAVDAMLETAADEAASCRCSLVTPGGERVPVTLEGTATGHEGGERVQLTLRDRRVQPGRTDRLSLLTEALDGTGQGITIADLRRPDEPLVYVNQTFAEMTGYDTEEALGRNCRFLQGPATNQETVSTLRTAIDQREPVTVRLLNYRADGTEFWNRLHLLPVGADDGAVTHYIGFQQDVTEQVARQRELERYRALVQAAGDPIYTLDADGRFRQVNDAFCALSGYDRVELVGKHISVLLDDQDIEQSADVISDLLAADDTDSTTTEIVVETASGERRLCSVAIAPLPFEEQFRGTVGVIRDITEPKGREQRLAVLERVLRHNLRNQTNVILSRAEHLLETASLSEAATDDVRSILDAADRLSTISEETRQFRDVVRLRRKEATTRDLVDLVESVVSEKRQCYETVDIDTDLPETATVSVRGRLRIAIDELVENAITHNDAETPTVSVTVECRADTVVVRVADNGPGIPDSDRCVANLGVEMPLDHASGLGLWLVRWTVEQSNGDISFEDTDDGAVVTIRLPHA